MNRFQHRALICLCLAATFFGAVSSSAQQTAPQEKHTGDSPLMQALLAEDFDTARRLIAARQDIETANRKGLTPLIRASARGFRPIVSELLKAGADVHRREANGATALSGAAHLGHLEVVKELIDHGADVNAVAWMQTQETPVVDKRHDKTPLMLALHSKNTQLIGLLLKHGANPSYLSTDGISALSAAASIGYEEAIRLLLEHGANPDTIKHNGSTALNAAIVQNQIGAMRVLLQSGADPDNRLGTNEGLRDRKLHVVPLVQAILLKRKEMVLPLLDAGADIEEIDRPPGVRSTAFAGMTPLVMAIYIKDAEMVEILLRRGANPSASDVKSDTGEMPIHAAAYWGDEKMIDLLVKFGANLYDRDKRGSNVMHYAAAGRNHEAIRLLAQRGMPLNARTRDQGLTPMMVAASVADIETVNLLAQLGADPRVKSNSGATAATIAAAKGKIETLKYLQNFNPDKE